MSKRKKLYSSRIGIIGAPVRDIECTRCGERFKLELDHAREVAQCPQCEAMVVPDKGAIQHAELLATGFVVFLLLSGVTAFLVLVFGG